MRAFGFLSPAILVIITLVYWPASQNQTDTLPTSSDYPPAGASCKQKGKLAVFNVMGVWVDFGKSIKCQFTVTSCKGTKNFASGLRTNKAGACADYDAAALALRDREVCCDGNSSDTKSPCREPKTPPWFDTNAPCDSVRMQPNPLARAELSSVGVTCSINYAVCGAVMQQWRSQFFSSGIISGVLGRTMTQEDAEKFCAAKGFGADTVPSRSVCCKQWHQAEADSLAFVRQNGPDAPGRPCNPVYDADCDGIENTKDPTRLGDCAKYPTSSPTP